jgi:AhpD family alkylhydroperoxidase
MPRLLFPQMLMLRLVQKGLTLDPTLADLVQIRTAFALGCSFCTDLHQAVALRAGRDRRKLRAVFDPAAADALSERERAALEMADAMAAGTPDDAVFERVRAAFDEQAIVELVWLCSFTRYLTSMAKAFHLESDELCALASP